MIAKILMSFVKVDQPKIKSGQRFTALRSGTKGVDIKTLLYFLYSISQYRLQSDFNTTFNKFNFSYYVCVFEVLSTQSLIQLYFIQTMQSDCCINVNKYLPTFFIKLVSFFLALCFQILRLSQLILFSGKSNK